MHDIFQVNENAYSLRSGITFTVPKSRGNGINTFDFRAVLAWNSLRKSVKDTDSLSVFKSNLRKEKIYCSCKKCL